MNELGNLIRYWAHYDTLLQGFQKQMKNVRDTRDKYEQQILDQLKAANLESAVIQIAGGRLLVSEERHSTPLSFRSLETMLHDYYRSRPGAPDETAQILRFIRGQRQIQVTKRLKRHAGPALLQQTDVNGTPPTPNV
jgi:hypothetical protein